jgi:Hydrazine synthase alpha subunit middle domain/WD40-like Beta Propeller Repeat
MSGRLNSARFRLGLGAAEALGLAGALAMVLSYGPSALASGPIVITESPPAIQTNSSTGDWLDQRYPAGSRLVLARPPFKAQPIHLLSAGLWAAGNPLVSPDGRRVIFVGKAAAGNPWQIFETPLPEGRPHPLTSMPGGAMDPAVLPDGRLVFASPVPLVSHVGPKQNPPALYAMAPGASPRQLTFSSVPVTQPVVLSDGRILFLSPRPSGSSTPALGLALYTINNDGTEITAFTGQHDPPTRLDRPRLLADGRLIFLAADPAAILSGGSPEYVRLARPFQSRASLFPNLGQPVRSVQPEADGSLLVCADLASSGGPRLARTLAVFRPGPGSSTLGDPLYSDPDWNSVEAVSATPQSRPRGRLSMVDLTKRTGQVLCLDANDTTYRPPDGGSVPAAVRMRVLAEAAPGKVQALGEVTVQADGSFMAEVPADIPVGFEALDAQGRIVRREAPMIWVRPGENRSCLGCHEPHNHSPHNRRPQALMAPVPCLNLGGTDPAQTAR